METARLRPSATAFASDLAVCVHGRRLGGGRVMYGRSLTATAICFKALRQDAARGYRLLTADADCREVAGITRSYRPGACTLWSGSAS